MEFAHHQKVNVFLYGTLMKGQSDHIAMANTEWVDYGETKLKFHLSYNGLPMVGSNIKVSTIKGDIFKIEKKKQLKELDELKGHP